jgi:hypothetical protein
MLQNCLANWLSIDINDADVQQTAAHSRLIWAQLAIIFTSDSRDQKWCKIRRPRRTSCRRQCSFAISCFEELQR